MVDLNAKIDAKSELAALQAADPFIKSWAELVDAAIKDFTTGLKDAGSSLHLSVDIKITGLYPEKAQPVNQLPDAPTSKTQEAS